MLKSKSYRDFLTLIPSFIETKLFSLFAVFSPPSLSLKISNQIYVFWIKRVDLANSKSYRFKIKYMLCIYNMQKKFIIIFR